MSNASYDYRLIVLINTALHTYDFSHMHGLLSGLLPGLTHVQEVDPLSFVGSYITKKS